MDRNVTVRFYEIEHQLDAGLNFADTLESINELPKSEREKQAPGSIWLRLEHLSHSAGLIFGDITRVQTENLPGHVTNLDHDPLPVDRIGHPAAFCYDPQCRTLALQFDIKIGVGRVCNYIQQFAEGQKFSHLPILREDALEKFEDETPTRLTVKVARIRNFDEVEDEIGDFEEAIETMGKIFGAPSVEITVSCKGKDGGLNKNESVSVIRRMLSFRDQIGGINKISGATIESDDAYNFIKFLLKEQETLNLPANDQIARFRGQRVSIV